MEKSKVKRIVKANIKRLQKLLGLETWEISIEYHATEEDSYKASCLAHIESCEALIVINPERMKDEADVLHALSHELAHCITSTFRTYKFAVANLLLPDEKVVNAIGEIYDRAEEEIVCSFCRILERTQ